MQETEVTMSYTDIGILLIFAAALIIGLREGAIKQLGSIAGIILGIMACRVWGADASRITAHLLGWEQGYASSVVGNLVVFTIAWVAVGLIARVLHVAVNAVLLGPLNRLLGAVVSEIKYFMALSIVLNLIKAVAPGCALLNSSRMLDGRVFDFIISMAPALFGTIVSN